MKINKTQPDLSHGQKKIRNKGFIRGQLAQSAVASAITLPSIGVIPIMKKVSNLTPQDTIELRKAAHKGLKESGLYDKGVRTYTITETPKIKEISKGIFEGFKKLIKGGNQDEAMAAMESIAEKASDLLTYDKKDQKALSALEEEIKSSKVIKRYGDFLEKMTKGSSLDTEFAENLKKTITEVSAKSNALMFKEGMNACFLPHANKIITPDKSLQTSVFHEMGHALNANGGVILKTLQKARPLASTIPGAVLMVSLLNKRKTTDEKLENTSIKNRLQNEADLIKKNAGKITAAAIAPMVIEEGLATMRGEGIAKNLVKDGSLSKELFGKIKTTNRLGFATYALYLVAATAGVKAAISVKDKIQAKHEAKVLKK